LSPEAALIAVISDNSAPGIVYLNLSLMSRQSASITARDLPGLLGAAPVPKRSSVPRQATRSPPSGFSFEIERRLGVVEQRCCRFRPRHRPGLLGDTGHQAVELDRA
jgi:hypothetical protein